MKIKTAKYLNMLINNNDLIKDNNIKESNNLIKLTNYLKSISELKYDILTTKKITLNEISQQTRLTKNYIRITLNNLLEKSFIFAAIERNSYNTYFISNYLINNIDKKSTSQNINVNVLIEKLIKIYDDILKIILEQKISTGSLKLPEILNSVQNPILDSNIVSLKDCIEMPYVFPKSGLKSIGKTLCTENCISLPRRNFQKEDRKPWWNREPAQKGDIFLKFRKNFRFVRNIKQKVRHGISKNTSKSDVKTGSLNNALELKNQEKFEFITLNNENIKLSYEDLKLYINRIKTLKNPLLLVNGFSFDEISEATRFGTCLPGLYNILYLNNKFKKIILNRDFSTLLNSNLLILNSICLEDNLKFKTNNERWCLAQDRFIIPKDLKQKMIGFYFSEMVDPLTLLESEYIRYLMLSIDYEKKQLVFEFPNLNSNTTKIIFKFSYNEDKTCGVFHISESYINSKITTKRKKQLNELLENFREMLVEENFKMLEMMLIYWCIQNNVSNKKIFNLQQRLENSYQRCLAKVKKLKFQDYQKRGTVNKFFEDYFKFKTKKIYSSLDIKAIRCKANCMQYYIAYSLDKILKIKSLKKRIAKLKYFVNIFTPKNSELNYYLKKIIECFQPDERYSLFRAEILYLICYPQDLLADEVKRHFTEFFELVKDPKDLYGRTPEWSLNLFGYHHVKKVGNSLKKYGITDYIGEDGKNYEKDFEITTSNSLANSDFRGVKWIDNKIIFCGEEKPENNGFCKTKYYAFLENGCCIEILNNSNTFIAYKRQFVDFIIKQGDRYFINLIYEGNECKIEIITFSNKRMKFNAKESEYSNTKEDFNYVLQNILIDYYDEKIIFNKN